MQVVRKIKRLPWPVPSCKVCSARALRMRSACSWCRRLIIYRSGRLLCGGGGECRCVGSVCVCAVLVYVGVSYMLHSLASKQKALSTPTI
eukprot:scaffold21618_cov63-Attheya_sp.AAC.7